MRVLIVTATNSEIEPLTATLAARADMSSSLRAFAHSDHEVHVLTTGVGMVATAAWCARTLAASSYDLALNLGVCGSFDPSLPPGTVVHVVSDGLPELGAEDGERFLTIHDLQLLGDDEFPFRGGRLVNVDPP